jgi:hypothetical protein
MNKGDKTLTVRDLMTKLLRMWKILGTWKTLSLGAVCMTFDSLYEDMRNIWSLETINLVCFDCPKWTNDFNPYT